MMKKLMAFALAMIMMVSFAGCGNVKKSDIVGYWESPNRVDYGTDGKVLWSNYTYTFYEDGSGTYSYIFNGSKSEGNITYKIRGNEIIIPGPLGLGRIVLTYDDSGSVPKLMGSQAEGYWYEKVSN